MRGATISRFAGGLLAALTVLPPALADGRATVSPVASAFSPVAPGAREAVASPVEVASPVLTAARQELSRTMEALRHEPEPPYFLSYEITEIHQVTIAGAFGTLTESTEARRRRLDIDLRVGDHELDNTHAIRGAPRGRAAANRFSLIEVPLEDDPAAIRAVLWFHTDQKYRQAVERLTQVRTNIQVKVEQEDRSADFSREEPQHYTEKSVPLRLDREAWEGKVRRYTAPFARHGDIYQARAGLTATAETRWFVNSEGTSLQTSAARYRLQISALTKAQDGMVLPRHESFFATTPEALPEDAKVLAAVERMIGDLHALRDAPVVAPYTGPAILSGRASGVFLHEVFGHRIEGHRQKREEEGQTFKKKVGEQLLPASFSILFDPTRRRAGGTELVGFYRYDNQGVKARPVAVVEDGIFRSFLLSRSPVEGFPVSNGHGRKQAGYTPVARQSNLIVEVTEPLTRDRLHQRLLEMIRAENKPFGLIFEDIQGGFTLTGRSMPNAFNVLPILVYRLYPDGRQELVRGVDLIGTPLTAFSNIIAADDTVGVFNGTCGAESGGVPVSSVSPGILISQIEVQKKPKSQDRPPLLPAPLAEPEDSQRPREPGAAREPRIPEESEKLRESQPPTGSGKVEGSS
jgi:predicted Zn-dependent protease